MDVYIHCKHIEVNGPCYEFFIAKIILTKKNIKFKKILGFSELTICEPPTHPPKNNHFVKFYLPKNV